MVKTTMAKTTKLVLENATYPAGPAGLVETWVANSPVALEIPKSATFAVKWSSSNILVGLTSL